MKSDQKIETKYVVPKSSLVVVAIALILSLVIYIGCLIIEYQTETLLSQGVIINEFRINLIRVAKDFTLIIISVAVTSIAGVLLVDVKSKNSIHKEIIQSDILLATDFYDTLTYNNKIEISKHLDSDLYFRKNNTLAEISSGLKDKVGLFSQQKYYFSSYSAIINCTIGSGKIIKKITKTMYLCSYDDTCILKDVELAKNICIDEDEKGFGIIEETFELEINDKRQGKKAYRQAYEVPPDNIEKKSGYNKKVVYLLNQSLVLKSSTPVKIKISYESIVDIKDNFYSIRLPVASKHADFQFNLSSNNNEHKDYKLVSCGFGFADTAGDTPNDLGDQHHVNLTFKEWIFPKDGWVVVIQKK